MKRMISRAAAEPPITGSFGVFAYGTITIDPVAFVTPQDSPVVASSANVPGVVSTGNIFDRADPNGTSSRVTQGVVINLPDGGQLQASQVTSWCRIVDNEEVYGGVTITAGRIIGNNNPTMSFSLPMHPAANDVITLPNGAGTITLNLEQGNPYYGRYSAIEANLTGGQTVIIADSRCHLTV